VMSSAEVSGVESQRGRSRFKHHTRGMGSARSRGGGSRRNVAPGGGGANENTRMSACVLCGSWCGHGAHGGSDQREVRIRGRA